MILELHTGNDTNKLTLLYHDPAVKTEARILGSVLLVIVFGAIIASFTTDTDIGSYLIIFIVMVLLFPIITFLFKTAVHSNLRLRGYRIDENDPADAVNKNYSFFGKIRARKSITFDKADGNTVNNKKSPDPSVLESVFVEPLFGNNNKLLHRFLLRFDGKDISFIVTNDYQTLLDIAGKLAKHTNVDFILDEDYAQKINDVKKTAEAAAYREYSPDELFINDDGDSVTAVIKWHSDYGKFLFSIPVLLVAVGFPLHDWIGDSPDKLTRAVFLGYALFTYVSFHYAAAMYVNRTEILIEDGKLKTTISPFPWFGEQIIKLDEIQDIEITENNKSYHGRNKFDLTLIKTNGNKLRLTGDLVTFQDARTIKNLIREKITHHLKTDNSLKHI
ncbi:MAG: hypothetical protein OEZ39_00305 [Gammaproteobacteria bacterium]|nr:hypothetical protein [Gammaproteobacteria bacterium]MDH5650289.1 hypothetical protein [Gammaproteobacteria bacterium]